MILSSDEIVEGDIVILKLGNQVPVDGVIIDGYAEFNEALLTGESDPVKKSIDGKVLAGSYVISGYVVIRATEVGDDRYV
jgi:cation-transporting ATPase E